MTPRHSRSWIPAALGALALTVSAAAWVAAQDGNPTEDSANCQTHLKQLSLGMMMYVQDYDEHYPPVVQWSPGVMPYIKNNDVYQCPSDAGKKHSYAMNANLCCGSLADIPEPAKIAMFFESNLHKPNASGTAPAVAKPPRHGAQNNYAYTDGHVKGDSVMPAFGKPLLPPLVNERGHKKKTTKRKKG